MNSVAELKRKGRLRRHARVRKKVVGTPERPRLSVFRSAAHISAQLIDDTRGMTLTAASTLLPEMRAALSRGSNVAAAREVGLLVAQKALQIGVNRVVFDRGGYRYHGRVLALAEAAREAGLEMGLGSLREEVQQRRAKVAKPVARKPQQKTPQAQKGPSQKQPAQKPQKKKSA